MNYKIKNNNVSVYVVSIINEIELKTHFRAIKDMIYDMSHLKLLNIHNILRNNNFDIIGYNNDCVLFENKDNIDISNLFNYENKIGCFKIEKDKKPIDRDLNILSLNQLYKLNNDDVIIHNINDEYNQEEFKNIYDNHNRTIIIGAGGNGKSYSVKKYDDDILFITPFNKLSIKINKDRNKKNKKLGLENKKYAITNNKLLGMHAIDDTKLESYDVSNIKTICFDEIYLYNTNTLMKIDKYIKNHPEIKFFATGDIS